MITKEFVAECQRCGNISREKESKVKENIPLINRVDLISLNQKGEIIEELSPLEYFICDDCWNDLLEFLDQYGRL